MSIPPLVCSTPPPPDQCEDEKDPEDYDLQYNLSQDDDDGFDYNFGNFSTYTSYPTQTSQNQAGIINDKKIENFEINHTQAKNTVEYDTNEALHEENDKCAENLKYDEDINIEDLNLKVDNQSTDTTSKESSVEISNDVSNIDGNYNIPSTSTYKENTTELEENTISESDFIVDERVETNSVQIVSEEFNTPPKSLEIETDNDFGDFDDFQYIRTDTQFQNIDSSLSQNPWENEVANSSGFGDFTANFDYSENNSKNNKSENVDIEKSKDSTYQPHEYTDESDFDDFKSSNAPTETKITQEESKSDHSIHVFDLRLSENESLVIENINRILLTIFPEEIIETENDIEVKLESLLSETWGFLIETDVRQPYIINWNNSLGQKTLLKALCIDSRNILFGPKWGHNMPKYAANLGATPLQPQKQLLASNITAKNEIINIEKPANNAGTWSDSLTPDGQESCNTEDESSVVEPRPTELDVFEPTLLSKPDKVDPSSIGTQPLRQINLPETHIYTPTDSETPRSKTTHFDCGPSIHLTQPTAGTPVIQTAKNSYIPVNENKTEEDEDWDFQGFKGTPKVTSFTPTKNYQIDSSINRSNENPPLSTPIQSIVNEIQVLQPIKLEPVIPTLNWPDPGEVNNVLDNFTDFVSNSTWSAQSCTIPQTNIKTSEDAKDRVTDAETETENTSKGEFLTVINNHGTIDDDFDTFQSALPPSKHLDKLNFQSSNKDTNSLSMIRTNQVVSGSSNDFVQNFQKVIDKSDSISSTNISKPAEYLATDLHFRTNATDSCESSVPISLSSHGKILQPTPANTSNLLIPNQQKSCQILHPLSLESYSQINWPSPGIDLQDLSRFNPVNTLHSLKSDANTSVQVKNSPTHNSKNAANNQVSDDDVWGEFVSSKPKLQPSQTKKNQIFNEDDEWSDFVSSSSIKSQNGLNTISLNVHTNSNIQKTVNHGKFNKMSDSIPLDIPTLNYVTPKTNSHKTYTERHFQNL